MSDRIEQEVRSNAKRRQAVTNQSLKKLAKRNEGNDFKNQKHVDIMSFNAGAEASFVELVRKILEEDGRTTVSISEVVREAAYELNVSTMTVKRYLTKFSARRAPLRVFGDAVMLNPNYRPPAGQDDLDE